MLNLRNLRATFKDLDLLSYLNLAITVAAFAIIILCVEIIVDHFKG